MRQLTILRYFQDIPQTADMVVDQALEFDRDAVIEEIRILVAKGWLEVFAPWGTTDNSSLYGRTPTATSPMVGYFKITDNGRAALKAIDA